MSYAGVLCSTLIGTLATLINLQDFLTYVKRFGTNDPNVIGGSLAEVIQPAIFGFASAIILFAVSWLSKAIKSMKHQHDQQSLQA